VMVEDDQLASRVAELTATACVELFAAYGVPLQVTGTDLIVSDEVLVSGVIGFVGPEVRGTCLLVGNRAPFAQSSPTKEHSRDWVGELTNQLVGRLKRKFSLFGLEVAVTTPVVLSGVHLRPMPRRDLSPRVLSADSGSVMVWVEVEAAPGFTLGTSPGESGDEEGDVLML